MSSVCRPVRTSMHWVLTVLIILFPVSVGLAQNYTTDFEPPLYAGSSSGTVVTGQDAWYLPAVTGSQDGNVFTYLGNTLGIPMNPHGGLHFEGGLGNATGPARAQRAVDFSAGGIWKAEWDCTGRWNNPTGPAVNNIGSISLQPSTSPPFVARYFQQLMSWGGAGNNYQGPNSPPADHLADFQQFHMHWGFFTAASPTVIAFGVPGPEWLDLSVNDWYHVAVVWDFDAAQILTVSIRNITAGGPTMTSDVTGLGWFLQGGPGSTAPLPTDIRLFAGGNGDISAWDNICISAVPDTCPCPGDMDGNGLRDGADLSQFVSSVIAGTGDLADVSGDNVVDTGDIDPFVTLLLAGADCPP